MTIFCYDRINRSDIINSSFVPTFGTPEINETIRDEAMALCGNDTECLFDVAVTNNLQVGESTMESVMEFNRRVAETYPGVCARVCVCACVRACVCVLVHVYIFMKVCTYVQHTYARVVE